jgi:dihydrofolate reductase
MEAKMRKVRIMEHVSLDGVISPPGDSDFAQGGWSAPYRTPAGAAALAEVQGTSFDLLLGRRTYDLWADYWPKVKGGPFADGLNAATKYVATHRPESLGWGPVVDLGTDVTAGVRRVTSTDGSDLIVWGSSTLTSVLLEQGLVGPAGSGQTLLFRQR